MYTQKHTNMHADKERVIKSNREKGELNREGRKGKESEKQSVVPYCR